MITVFRILRSVALYLFVILLLMVTSPKNIPSVLLIVPFVLLFVANFMTVTVILDRINGRINAPSARVYFSRPRMIAVLIAGFPVLLLVLQSIGQLTVRDTLTACVIFILAYFYIVKSSSVRFSKR